MVLNVQVRKTATKLDLDGYRNLEDLARALEVVLPDGVEPVAFSQTPPADLRIRWQELDSTGAMVGQVKTWNNGTWA